MQKNRNKFRSKVRNFFEFREYLEVETPVGVISPGVEVHLDYFKTSWLDFRGNPHDLYLRSSPEIHMKQLLSQNEYKKIFQFSTCFRNGGEFARWHHPEFLMLEWYEKGICFEEYMSQTESLISEAFSYFSRNSPLKFQRLSVFEAFESFVGIELIDKDCELAEKAKTAGVVSVQTGDDFETSFFKILIEKIEPQFKAMNAVSFYDYPESQAALAKVVNGKAKRFETYVHGVEISNGYWELLDPIENQGRIDFSNEERLKIKKGVIPVDQDFIKALQLGVDSCCGNALGMDRLLALALGHQGVDQVIPFRNAQPFGQRPDM